MGRRTLTLASIEIARDRIAATCTIDDLSFKVSVWYEDVDLRAVPDIERLAFHVAMFNLNSVVSLRPDAVDVSAYGQYATPAFCALWSTVIEKVWAQWRYEHDLPGYLPELIGARGVSTGPRALAAGPVELLAFCGGGKDSLVALRLLERAGLPFATLGYSHSIYGAAAPQHALLDRVGNATARVRAERQWIFDDFLDAPLHLRDAGTITAAETPASVFDALPLAVARGYKHLVLAHEASANHDNLVWRGEEVNHQWGKSFAAEQLLAEYVAAELVDVGYWSVLQPVHDEVIFELLARDAELAPLTHSCNVAKPWCGTCAKCAYVWLQMAAHLPADIVAKTFGGRVLSELPENDHHFRELFGLTSHSPFECVGSPAEAKLALSQLRDRGRLAEYAGEAVDPSPFLTVGTHRMPADVAAAVMPILVDAAASARVRLTGGRS